MSVFKKETRRSPALRTGIPRFLTAVDNVIVHLGRVTAGDPSLLPQSATLIRRSRSRQRLDLSAWDRDPGYRISYEHDPEDDPQIRT